MIMDRRKFLKRSGQAAIAAPVIHKLIPKGMTVYYTSEEGGKVQKLEEVDHQDIDRYVKGFNVDTRIILDVTKTNEHGVSIEEMLEMYQATGVMVVDSDGYPRPDILYNGILIHSLLFTVNREIIKVWDVGKGYRESIPERLPDCVK